ncbi:hypothetical protein AZE42_09638 [Rhizopogon vesiculosus]|uniref:Hemerythrin-like domain-containing protein n=1 Tax=Rhizopogon vesiculosus TaxID=180088 RepID=A0A1J8R1J6_9AGAM|nr:hypothetical protein AZE42_09638 [Rhizopogon vesiculosus]
MATNPESKTPLTDAITHDHREMYAYYQQFKQNKGDTDAQGRWAHQLMWEVARHAVGEEIIVYPLMEKQLGEEGTKLADQDRNDHQTVKELLAKLEALQVGTAEFDSILERAMATLHKHNDSEEQNDLPRLEMVLHPDHSKEAAAQFRRTKHFVPTRPHPMAPNKPPYETLVGFMAAPIDKLKDLFTTFPTEEMKKDAGL